MTSPARGLSARDESLPFRRLAGQQLERSLQETWEQFPHLGLPESLATEIIRSIVLEWHRPGAGRIGPRWDQWAELAEAHATAVSGYPWSRMASGELFALLRRHHAHEMCVELFFGRVGHDRIRELADAGMNAWVEHVWQTRLLPDEAVSKLKHWFFINVMLLSGAGRPEVEDPLWMRVYLDAALVPSTIELHRRASRHIGYVAAKVLFLLHARQVGSSGIGEEDLSRAAQEIGRLALSNRRAPIQPWIRDEIQREVVQPDPARPPLWHEIESQAIKTIAARWNPLVRQGWEATMWAVLEGRLNIAPRAIRDDLVQARRPGLETIDIQFRRWRSIWGSPSARSGTGCRRSGTNPR